MSYVMFVEKYELFLYYLTNYLTNICFPYYRIIRKAINILLKKKESE